MATNRGSGYASAWGLPLIMISYAAFISDPAFLTVPRFPVSRFQSPLDNTGEDRSVLAMNGEVHLYRTGASP